MKTFHKLQIKDAHVDGQSAKIIEFALPDALKETYQYTAGQHLTLKHRIENQEVRRSYSICKPESSQTLCIGVRQVQGGLFSNWLYENAIPGLEIDVMPPTGSFSYAKKEAHHWFFAAGCGITPIISIIESLLETQQTARASLFYVNKTSLNTMVIEELQDIKNAYLNRLNIYFLFSQEKQQVNWMNGRLDKQKLLSLHQLSILTPTPEDHAYICGPNEMIDSIKNYLPEIGIPENHIHFESFGQQYANKKEKVNITGVKVTFKTIDKYTSLQFDGQTSLLDLGLQNDLNLPFACQAGACGTCRCKLIKGEVVMANNNALDTYETDAGIILSCQSLPKTGEREIEIDYDI